MKLSSEKVWKKPSTPQTLKPFYRIFSRIFLRGNVAFEWVGDLMLSLPRVQLQAEENGWDLRTELVRMLAHGCAHLAGWDHERSVEEAEAMLKCEKLMLEKAGFDKIYNE